MKPTKTLIAALYAAADRIENDLSYRWSSPKDCNCGILAQEVLNITDTELYKINLNSGHGGSWSLTANSQFCETTGRPLTEIFSLLHEHGLEKNDFRSLESIPHLNGVVLTTSREYRNGAAAYFRQRAAELEIRRSNGEKP